MNKVLFATVLLTIISTTSFAENKQIQPEPNQLTVQQLLQKFAESRQNMNSYVIDGLTDAKFTNSRDNYNGTMYIKFSFRYGGNRNKTTQYIWGDVGRTPNLSESQANYSSALWDGDSLYSYNRGKPSEPGMVVITNAKDKNFKIENTNLVKYSYSGEVNGYHWGDGVTIDKLLINNSETLKLREKREAIRGADCFVIEAVVKGRGKYTIWIDPVHDYHIAKIHVQRRANDHIGQNKLGATDYSNETFEVIRFQRVGDAWFPEVCKFKHNSYYYKNLAIAETNIKFTNCLFNPDHEALKSFSTDDIPNGTAVNLCALPPSGQKFTWRDGKVIDKNDKEVDLGKLEAQSKKTQRN
jgi:hypothetical protein